MKKITYLLILFVTVSGVGLGQQKIIPVEGLEKPLFLTRDDSQIYVSETKPSILIYDAASLKLKKKFGKQGEGPEEFMAFAFVFPFKDKLMVNSLGKLTFWTREGTFLRELKNTAAATGFGFLPVEGGYVAQGRAGDIKGLYSTITFYNEKLEKVKELYRIVIGQKGLSKIDILSANVPYQAHKNVVYIPGSRGFEVVAVDTSGNQLFRIQRKNYEPRKFTKDVERDIHKLLESGDPRQYEFLRNRMVFPEYFPVFSFFYKDLKSGLLYFFTWKFKEKSFECFIYTGKGEFVKRTEIPFQMQGVMRPYPLMVYDWKVYQLVDNSEEEQWELHITDIKH